MSSDIVEKFPTLGECNRYTNGMCSTRSCLIRGGWRQGDAVDYDLATCETRDIRKTIEALEGEVAALKANPDKAAGRYAVEQIRRAEAADARAERLRVALTKAHNDLDISPLTDKEREAVVDEISAAIEEDDKQ